MSVRHDGKIIAGSGGGNGESISNQNKQSDIKQVYDWIGTLEEYETQQVAELHPTWVCFILDDTKQYNHQLTNRNVGDIFYTLRKDEELNGAVECNGNTYDFTDFEGKESIGNLLKANKLPYISLSEYTTQLETTNGTVGVFGWDGEETTTFRVPKLEDIFVESGNINNVGEFVPAGLPNINGNLISNAANYVRGMLGFDANGALQVVETSTSTPFEHYGWDNWSCPSKINFDASRSSAIYGNSITVQPKAIRYRPMVQLFTGFADEAVETCQNVKSDVENLNNHALLDNKITNCVTYIPQDIKFEIDPIDSHLVLKAGSKVYIPNGFEADGTTRKFDVKLLKTDYKYADTATSQITYACSIQYTESTDTWHQWRQDLTLWVSGPTAPENPSDTQIWYDTTNNLIKRYLNNVWNSGGYALPLGIATFAGHDAICSSIDQVFNGFGYISDEFYVLPGVKCVMPDGRNEDGSLKNIEFTTTRVDVCHDCDRKNPMFLEHCHKPFFLHSDGYLQYANCYVQQKNKPSYKNNYLINYWYNTDTNQIWYYRQQNPEATPVTEIRQCACVGQYLMSSNGITNFRSKQDIQVLDYNDTEFVGHQAMPSNKYIDLTLGASGTSYTAPADGYVWASGTATNAASDLNISDNTATYSQSISSGADQGLNVQIVIRKGRKFSVGFNYVTLTRIRFSYAEGSK